MELIPTAVVVMIDNQNAGECYVIRAKQFEYGIKYEIKDMWSYK